MLVAPYPTGNITIKSKWPSTTTQCQSVCAQKYIAHLRHLYLRTGFHYLPVSLWTGCIESLATSCRAWTRKHCLSWKELVVITGITSYRSRLTGIVAFLPAETLTTLLAFSIPLTTNPYIVRSILRELTVILR